MTCICQLYRLADVELIKLSITALYITETLLTSILQPRIDEAAQDGQAHGSHQLLRCRGWYSPGGKCHQ